VEQAHRLVQAARLLPADEAVKALEQVTTIAQAAQAEVLAEAYRAGLPTPPTCAPSCATSNPADWRCCRPTRHSCCWPPRPGAARSTGTADTSPTTTTPPTDDTDTDEWPDSPYLHGRWGRTGKTQTHHPNTHRHR